MTRRTSIEITSLGEGETHALARRLAAMLGGGELIALDGPLGAGKTAFVRGLAEALGVEPTCVASPTFVLCHEYLGSGSRRLVHVDAYRIHDVDELETLGFDELLADPTSIVAVEWASRIAAALPADRIDIEIEHAGPTERVFTVTGPATLVAALDPASSAACPSCGRLVPTDAESFPFCSERCRLVDLGRWMRGAYRISRPMWEPEEDDGG